MDRRQNKIRLKKLRKEEVVNWITWIEQSFHPIYKDFLISGSNSESLELMREGVRLKAIRVCICYRMRNSRVRLFVVKQGQTWWYIYSAIMARSSQYWPHSNFPINTPFPAECIASYIAHHIEPRNSIFLLFPQNFPSKFKNNSEDTQQICSPVDSLEWTYSQSLE